MKINSSTTETSFSAKLNKKTRTLIQEFDKIYNQNLEGRIDSAIEKSPLGDFYDNRATISFLETENPHCNIAPVINIEINGITSSHILKGSSVVCDVQDEEFLLEKMNRRPHRYINTIINRLNSESTSEIKKGLALDYIKQAGIDISQSEVNETTLDLFI